MMHEVVGLIELIANYDAGATNCLKPKRRGSAYDALSSRFMLLKELPHTTLITMP